MRADRQTWSGLGAGTVAFLIWGLSPLYFRSLRALPATEILAHRVVWSALLVAILVTAKGRWPGIRSLLLSPKARATFAVTTVLISFNWLIFIWAVNDGRVLQASLGYFLNPLVNVLLGVLVLKETLSTRQRIAVLLAMAGVLNLIVGYGVLPWVSVTLAVSFAFYGLLRKTARADSLDGLLVETALLCPVALGYLLYAEARGTGAFNAGGAGMDALLALAGVITAVPLLGFVHGARRLRLSTIGLLQYLAPTCQFLLAVLVFGEPFTRTHAATFACIWAGLVLYTSETFASRRTAVAGASGR